jgi:AraC family transcriptional activator of pobA
LDFLRWLLRTGNKNGPEPSMRRRAKASAQARSVAAQWWISPSTDTFPIQVQKIEAYERPGSRPRPFVTEDKLRLILITRGGGGTAEGRCRSVTAPSLILIPRHPRVLLRFAADSCGFIVSFAAAAFEAAVAREPSLTALFDELKCVAPLVDAMNGPGLEARIADLARELAGSAAAGMSAAEAHLQLVLTHALRAAIPQGASFAGTGPDDQSPGNGPNSGDGTDPDGPSPLNGARPGVARPGAALILRFRRLVLAHFRHNWQLSDYAAHLHVSLARLRTACVKTTGVPPVQLINECAIREAQRMLRSSALPVSSIAHELGFDDPAYFSRLFRAKCGTTASRYRVANAEMYEL